MKKVLILTIAGIMVGACSMAVNDSPRTTPPGKFLMGFNIGSYVYPSSGTGGVLPLVGIMGRYGLTEDMDLGFRLLGVGVGMEVKKAFNRQTAVALGAQFSSFGALFYDLYGTFIYGFKPYGATPYIYLRPHYQGFTGAISDQDTTYLFGANAFTLQGGFGFYGNPDRTVQPSIELGFIYPVAENSTPIFTISLGLNFQIGD